MTARTRLIELNVLDPSLDWLVAFCEIAFSSGRVITDVTLRRAGSRVWASPQSPPWTRGTDLILENGCEVKWQKLRSLMKHGRRVSWSCQCVAAVRAEHPELCAEEITA